MASVVDRLKGGDLRSIGAANEVARDAKRDPTLVKELFAGLASDEPVLRMRCADALEKLTRTQPAHLSAYRSELLELLDPDQPKEVLWHVVQMCPRIRWQKRLLPKVFSAVEACLGNESSIVKTSAMQALFELSAQVPARTGEVRELISKLSRTGTPAMKARGAKLLRALGG